MSGARFVFAGLQREVRRALFICMSLYRMTNRNHLCGLVRLAAFVAFAASRALADSPDDFDPKPKPDDFVLPMPNGARMVFRPVFLGVGDGKLAEKTFRAGDRSGAREKEKLTKVTLGGSFVDPVRKDWFFYIGKYEVTSAQFGAFRAEIAQTENFAQRSRYPQTGITRSEVEAFIDAYNIWLRAGHVSKLPRYEGAPGYLRLPSEQEWEFAARGGGVVPVERFEKATPYEGELAKFEWFAGPRSSHGKLKEIGLLEPNPLGIFDLLGNAAEMTSTPYQIQIGQGKSGGFTVRGGSFRTAPEDLRSSLRTEQPLFGRDGLAPRDETIGFRLVIASQVITDDNRQALELAARTPAALPPADAPGNAAPELKALITSISRRLQIIENQRKALIVGGAVVAAKNSRVRVIRAEPLYFRTTISRTAAPGEVFIVAAHDPVSKKVFVIDSDAKGAAVALNVAQEACELVPRDAEAIFTDALVSLRDAKFAIALPFLQQAAKSDPRELAYAQLSDAAQRLAQALRERELAKEDELRARQTSINKLKSAAVADRPNRLFPGNDNQRRAEAIRKEGEMILENAQARLATANGAANEAASAFAALTLSQAEVGAYDIALSAQRCLSACGFPLVKENIQTKTGTPRTRKSPRPGIPGLDPIRRAAPEVDAPESPVAIGGAAPTFVEMPGRITQACALYDQAAQACRERQLYHCRKLIASGLDAMPGHRPLRKLRVEVDGDIGLTDQAVKLASALEQNAENSGVKELTKNARLLCQDCTALTELIARIGAE